MVNRAGFTVSAFVSLSYKALWALLHFIKSPVFSEKDVLYKLYSYIAQWVAKREPLQIMQ